MGKVREFMRKQGVHNVYREMIKKSKEGRDGRLVG
jgi:hypothetical protein